MDMISRLVTAVKRIHLNYNMITSLYMMEPMERTIINCIIILVTSLMLYSSWVYLPHYTWKLLVFSGILSNGGSVGENMMVGDEDSIYDYKSEL